MERALEAGVEETGVTVHFMVEEVDAGPIVAQERVPVLPGDTKETLLERLHPVEHRLLVRAVADYFLGGRHETARPDLGIGQAGIEDFARRLPEMGFEIISTGGTARTLAENGVPVDPRLRGHGRAGDTGREGQDASPQDPRRHPRRPRRPRPREQLVEQGISPIDLVCINLYPFEETVAGGASEKEAIEQIDIGGPAMLRAAAKNFGSVTVVPSPELYDEVLAELERGDRSPRRPAAVWPSPPSGAPPPTTRPSRPGSASGTERRLRRGRRIP